MDKDTLISFKILDALNRARKEKGEFTRVNLKDIADELSMDFDFFMIRYGIELHKLGYIVSDVGNCAYITEKGIAMLERNNPFYQDYRPVENKNIIINAPVTGSAIIQGDNNSVNITFDFLAKLEKEIAKSSLPPEEKKTWLSRIKEFGSHPVSASLAKVLEMFTKSQMG
ncbi:MAG: hypothetical protein DDT41_01807 [candidate division WS2 bacterium]|nr:hypothetical protein [Candidatus Psychracetigena formicireducens]